MLNIGKNVTEGEVIIENALGQVVYTQNVSNGENKIDTKHIPNGVYFYSVTDGNVMVGKGKVVISH